jgi:phospholipase C
MPILFSEVYIMSRKILLILSCSFSLFFGSLLADENLMQTEIKHVVVLVLENRSFDNVLTWLYSNNDAPQHFIPSTMDPHYLGLSEDTLDQYTNVLKNSQGETVFSCAPIKGVPSIFGSKLINSPKFDPNEPFDNVTAQIFNGSSVENMGGFLQDYATLWSEDDWLEQKKEICAVMETYTEKELPLMYGLAKHYAVSDYYFSSIPSQTNCNRAFSICGTSDGQVNNGFAGKSLFTSDTIWNRLSEESPQTTWTVFWQSDLIPVLFPGPLSGTNLFSSLHRIPNLNSHFKRFNEFHDLARKGQLPDISYLEPQWTLSLNISPKEKDYLDDIFRNEDFIVGFQGNDLHPPGDVRTAENLVANVYTSLIANEEAWNHTLFVIVFDEHGGLFDHVVPPPAIAPDDQNQDGFNFNRYGVRVPAIFISPRIKERTLFRSDNPHIPFDHTSIIATLLKWKHIDKSKWRLGNRVAIAPTFDPVITLATPRTDQIIPGDKDDSADANVNDVVKMGDKFYIKDAEGNYLIKSPKLFKHTAHVGSVNDRVAYEFAGGVGNVKVGSFALIQCCDSSLEEKNLLQTSLTDSDCIFGLNSQNPKQWWSIKCMGNNCTGTNIRYGDKVYLENHLYLDAIQYVPCRLVKTKGIFGNYVKALPINEEGIEDAYWILERA